MLQMYRIGKRNTVMSLKIERLSAKFTQPHESRKAHFLILFRYVFCCDDAVCVQERQICEYAGGS